MVIIAELGEPALHLGPAVFLQRAGVALATHDPHVRSPFSRRVSPAQLANPAFSLFHVSNIKLQLDKAKINIRAFVILTARHVDNSNFLFIHRT
jgi:hypothetical protein